MSWEQNFSRGYHVETLKYFYSKEHSVIGTGSLNKLKIRNIGDNAENLSFAVLSMNRSSLTIRLLNSVKEQIPNFAGEFVIGDNGSIVEEKDKIRQEMAKMPFRCRMIEFDKNYGVAGGRNRLFAEIKTDWLLSADNDLYFVGNPLKKIQSDIATLGCHFLGLPLIEENSGGTGIYGGHLYVENVGAQISIGGASAVMSPKLEINVERDPFLCTFLPGGVAVINKDTFFKCGGFDEGMFVGFEDTEFSVRLFQEGYKIGFAGIACIIHDHPKPEKKADESYEKERFSRNFLKESARHFEKKHNICVWNPTVENWVEGRLNELLINSTDNDNEKSITVKPKIALVIDAYNWALDHVADQVIKNLNQYYDFRRIYLSEVDNLAQVLYLADDCQVVHFLWRPLASDFYSSYTQNKIAELGLTSDSFYERFIENKTISVAVYDHLMLDYGPDSNFTKLLFSDSKSIVDSYTVSSNRLWNVYNNKSEILKKPVAVTPDGVDLKLFRPINLERFEDIGKRTIKIGWVGNSKWQVGDLKGINTIISPAVEALKKKGYDVDLVTTDRQKKLIPHEDMPEFYAEIDLYICASTCEGTPNPILEAMACGVPIITTDVGLVPDCFGTQQAEYVLEERTVQCLVNKVEKLLNNLEEFSILSKENLRSIKSWDWTIMTKNFKDYFDSCLLK